MKNYKNIFFPVIFCAVIFFSHASADDLTATDVRPGKNAMYVIHFTCQTDLYAYDEIVVVFRSPVDVSNVLMAFSNKIIGGFAVNVKGDTVFVKRTGQGNTVTAGEMCDLSLATVINPDPVPEKVEYIVMHRREEQILSKQVYKEPVKQKAPADR